MTLTWSHLSKIFLLVLKWTRNSIYPSNLLMCVADSSARAGDSTPIAKRLCSDVEAVSSPNSSDASRLPYSHLDGIVGLGFGSGSQPAHHISDDIDSADGGHPPGQAAVFSFSQVRPLALTACLWPLSHCTDLKDLFCRDSFILINVTRYYWIWFDVKFCLTQWVFNQFYMN